MQIYKCKIVRCSLEQVGVGEVFLQGGGKVTKQKRGGEVMWAKAEREQVKTTYEDTCLKIL